MAISKYCLKLLKISVFTYLSLMLTVLLSFRLLVYILPNYQQGLCNWLENKLHSDITIKNLVLDWNGGYPLLQLGKLQIAGKNATSPALIADELKLELDLYKLLVSFKLSYNTISTKKMVINLENTDINSWSLLGVASLSRSWDSKNNLNFNYFLTQVLKSRVAINDVSINLYTNSKVHNIKIPQILIDQKKHGKILQAGIYADDKTIEISGQSTTIKQQESWQGKLKISDILVEDLQDFIYQDFSIVKNCSVSIDGNWYADNTSVKVDGLIYLKNVNNHNSMNLASKFFYHASDFDVFNLWLQDICCNYHDASQCALKANIFISNKFVNKKHFICNASNLHLHNITEIINHFLYTDNKYFKTIQQLDPKGAVDNFYLKYNLDTISRFNKLELTAILNNISIKATTGIPELTNVSGKLSTTENSGVFHVNSTNFDIHIPNIYNKKMHYNYASTFVKWYINNNYVNISLHNINLIGDKEQVRGALKLNIPTKAVAPPLHLSLLLSAKDTTLNILPKYLPKEAIVSNQLNNWLNNSLHNAHIDQITYLFNGYLQKQNNRSKHNQTRLFCIFNDLTIDIPTQSFSLDKTKGKLALDNTKVDIIATSAELLKNNIQHLEASATLNNHSKLSVHAVMQSENNQIKDLLTHVLDNTKLTTMLQNINIDGLIHSKVDAHLPLSQETYSPVIDINSKITNVNIDDKQNNLKINNVNGSFNYNNTTGLNTDFITAYLFDEKHTFEIKSTLDSNTNQIKTISGICNGNISFKNVGEFIDYPIDNFLSGKMRHRCTFDFYPATNENYFTLESNLEGVSSNLPQPFYKESTKLLPIHLRFYANKNNHKQVNLELENNNSININIKNSNTANQKSNDNKTYILDGNIATVNAKDWFDFFNKLPKTEQSSNFQLDNLRIKELNYEDINLKNLEIKSKQSQNYYNFEITSDIVTGDISFAKNNKLPIILDFKKIILENTNTVKSNSLSLLEDKILNMDWQDLPSLTVKIDQLNYNNLKINKINFAVDFTDNILKISDLKTNVQDTDIQLFADWQKINGINKCWIQGDVSSNSKNSLLNDFFKKRKIISTKKASISFALGWDDKPLNVKKNKLYGNISAVLKDGQINKIEKNTQILKPLGLFNADSLFKRLKLDFSDLFSSGYSFDSLKGSCLLSYGKIYTDDYIIMTSPSSTQKLSGMVDINSNQLELDLVITLPIVSNLPIISLFLAANPMLSALIFIADKAIGKKINALANISYRIHGDADNPKIVLKKL